MRSASGSPPHSSTTVSVDWESYGPCSCASAASRSSFLRACRVQCADRQLMDPGRDVGGQLQGLAGGDEDEAVGTLGNQRADLGGVAGVVEDDRHRGAGQMLVVQLAQPPHLLLGKGPSPSSRLRSTGGASLSEQQLFAGRAQPVQQMQQRVTRRQRRLPGHVAAQVHHAGAPELVLQAVRRPYRERGAPGAGRTVQDDDGRLGLRRRTGLPHPLRDLRQLGPSPGERPLGRGQMTERLVKDRAHTGRCAAVPAAQRRGGPRLRGDLFRRCARRGGEHPLLVEERTDAPYFQRRQPLQPQLFGAAGLSECTCAPVGGGPVRCGDLGDGRRGPRDRDDGARAEGRPRRRTERDIRAEGGDRGNSGHQQWSSHGRSAEPLRQRLLSGLRRVQRLEVRGVLVGSPGRQGVERGPPACRQRTGVRPAARPPYLLLDGAYQQPFGFGPMAVPHVCPPPDTTIATAPAVIAAQCAGYGASARESDAINRA